MSKTGELHGTHVAGIVGANWNGFGTIGGANGVRLAVMENRRGKQSTA
ncbi:MAG: S8 family serine peptidase [Clostridia bacterium]|nr:S8 family serine peptidase [Clostridia bacterium]